MPTPAQVVVLPQQAGAALRLEHINLPDPGPYQVVVRQQASGICHSQIHQINSPRDSPLLLGHESTGEVVKTGAEVSHVKEGDTVMLTWVPRNISASRRQATPISLAVSDGVATAPVFTWADYSLADEQFVVKVAPEANRDVTAIIGCAVMTGAGAVINTAGVVSGDSVAVFGVGGVGLSAIAGARIVGADPIIAIDLSAEKLAMAKQFGATHLIDASQQDVLTEIHNITPNPEQLTALNQPASGVDYAFDCIGIRQTMEQLLPACRGGEFGGRVGGTGVVVGVPTTPVELDALNVVVEEKKFVGSCGGSCLPERDFPQFINWYDKGQLDLEKLVTKRYRLDQINEATKALAEGKITGRAIIVF